MVSRGNAMVTLLWRERYFHESLHTITVRWYYHSTLKKMTLWYLHRNSRSIFTVYYMVRSRLQLHMSQKHMVRYYFLVSYVAWLSRFFSVHVFCTYIIGVEALSDCSEHIELSVFLMEAEHVRQMIRVKSQRPESREDHASFISRRHAARLFSPVESSISLTENRILINV